CVGPPGRASIVPAAPRPCVAAVLALPSATRRSTKAAEGRCRAVPPPEPPRAATRLRLRAVLLRPRPPRTHRRPSRTYPPATTEPTCYRSAGTDRLPEGPCAGDGVRDGGSS